MAQSLEAEGGLSRESRSGNPDDSDDRNSTSKHVNSIYMRPRKSFGTYFGLFGAPGERAPDSYSDHVGRGFADALCCGDLKEQINHEIGSSLTQHATVTPIWYMGVSKNQET